jgi:hypothetical protein
MSVVWIRQETIRYTVHAVIQISTKNTRKNVNKECGKPGVKITFMLSIKFSTRIFLKYSNGDERHYVCCGKKILFIPHSQDEYPQTIIAPIQ